MELTIALLFFSLAAAVCLQLFVKSHNINRDCNDASNSHTIATSLADAYRDGELDDTLALEPEKTIYYDINFTEIPKDGVVSYIASLKYDKGTLDINVGSLDNPDCYSLSVYRFIPEVSE